MSARWLAVALLLAPAACTSPSTPDPQETAAAPKPVEAAKPAEPAKPAEAAKPAAPTRPAAPGAAPTQPAPSKPTGGDAPLPGADRVFVAPLDGQNLHLLGADGDTLWAVRPTAPGRGVSVWSTKGPGVALKVAYGDIGNGPKLYVAWGVGRGFLQAPLVVDALDPATGVRSEIWRANGERNDAAHLQVADVDRDGAPELAFARYASKYMVEPRHFEKDGTARPGAAVRMASSWLFADVDGQPGPDAVIGRVYGDAKGLPGDLRVQTADTEIRVPTEMGVKSVLVAAAGGEPSALYFADGWVANYGKEAKAQLKRLQLGPDGPRVEFIGRSPDEFTFFDLTEVDLNGDGVTEIAARGNKRITLFEKTPDGWKTRPLADIEPVLNTAIGRAADGTWTLFVPAKPVVRAVPVR